ncbi:hypothetical protein KEM55_002993 [Ascosphaera atra]|nr:hypothetical protein KEM55_002993 [Ascosphaera atra]
MLRQFSPPEDAIKITKEWLDKKRPRDLIEAEQFDEEYEWRIGKFLDKKTRARILMDQKESSVADVAEALRIVKEEEDAKKQPQNKEAKEKKKLSRKAKAKLKMQKQREKIHDKETRRRLADLEAQLSKEMTTHAERAHRKLAKKVLDDVQAQQQPPKYEVKISEADEETAHANPPADEIRMFWVDVEDANYAKDWPSYVYHGKLSPNREHIIEHRLDLQHVARNRAEAEEAERAERTRAARAALDEPGSPFLEEPKKKGLLSKLKFW